MIKGFINKNKTCSLYMYSIIQNKQYKIKKQLKLNFNSVKWMLKKVFIINGLLGEIGKHDRLKICS